MKTIYDYSLPLPNGEEMPLSNYKGKVLLIVNTATKCGFTPQYEIMEDIYEEYQEKGLEILDIPCNQFMNQAAESQEEIHRFCTLRFRASFPQFKKSEVNGPNALPVYAYLKENAPFKGFGDSEMAKRMEEVVKKNESGDSQENDVKWNFTKFLIGKDGHVINRFEPTADMEEVKNAIIDALNQN